MDLDRAFQQMAQRDLARATQDPVAARRLLADTLRGLEIAERQVAQLRNRSTARPEQLVHAEDVVSRLRADIEHLRGLI